MSPIIAAWLKRFIETDRHGLPWDEDIGTFTEDKLNYVDHNQAKENWDSILHRMLYAFEDNEPDPVDYVLHYSEGPEHGKEHKTGGIIYDMVCDTPDEFERYEADMKLHQIKKQQGLDLFAKFYHNLWD